MSNKRQKTSMPRSTNGAIRLTDVLSIVAIIISFLTFVFSIWQTNRQYYSQKKENQPIFQLKSYYTKCNNDSVFDTDVVEIKNIGREALSLENTQYVTFIKLEVRNNQHQQLLYIPVTGYYTLCHRHGLIGDVETNLTPGNNLDYHNFYIECMQNSKDSNYYFCNLIKFVIIHYMDIYDEKHVVYFESDNKCSEEYYMDVIQKSKETFKDVSFDIHELKLKDLMDYITINDNV